MLYIKNGQIKNQSQIVIIKDDKQIINPKIEDILSDGWAEYIQPEPTLEEVRQQKIAALMAYDESDNVNWFYVDGVGMWYDYKRRGSINRLVESTKMLGGKTITLWTETPPIIGIPFECDAALLMLAELEVFAGKSKSNTQQHWANILALKTKEEVEAYDFTTGYPEKPHFVSTLKV